MGSSPYPKTTNEWNELELGTGVKWSLGIHLAVVLFLLVKTYFISSETIDYESAIRVDIVGLPDKLDPKKLAPAEAPPEKLKEAEAPPPPPPAEVAKETPKLPEQKKVDPETVNLDAVKKKQQQALNKLKSMSAIEKIKKDLESKKESESKAAEKASTQVKGNILSAGTELTGLNKLQHENYVAQIDRQIKQNWAIPEWLAKKDYKAQILLKIDEKGQITFRQIVKSSGNPNYDDAVLETIDKSAPYPAPPEKLIAIIGTRGMLIGFPE